MRTEAQRGFLAGLQIREDGRGSVTLVVNGDAIADVTGSIELDVSAHDAAQEIVAACHDAATWAPVIEAAREVYASGAINESEATREAASPALVHCADCRFWIRVQGNEGDCTAHKHSVVSRRDCYCSWGEEKDAVR